MAFRSAYEFSEFRRSASDMAMDTPFERRASRACFGVLAARRRDSKPPSQLAGEPPALLPKRCDIVLIPGRILKFCATDNLQRQKNQLC